MNFKEFLAEDELKAKLHKAVELAFKYVLKELGIPKINENSPFLCESDKFGPVIRMKDGEILVLVDEPTEFEDEDGNMLDNSIYRSGVDPKPWYVIIKGNRVVKAIDGKEDTAPSGWDGAENMEKAYGLNK